MNQQRLSRPGASHGAAIPVAGAPALPPVRAAAISTVRAAAGALALAWTMASPALAQNDRMVPIAAPPQAEAIVLGTGPLPGAAAQESWHRQYGSVFARNVTVATLTPFLPPPGKATGAAVIVAPGGGFRTLSMNNEGWDVAQALADRGVAAFVLKYRLNQTPADMAGFERSMAEMFSATAKRPPAPQDPATTYAPQIADARAAFALVRARARAWQVDTDRIGMIGFSAGGGVLLSSVYGPADGRPDFAIPIYAAGASGAVPPPNAPPLFVAVASDDKAVGYQGSLDLFGAWIKAGLKAELHVFQTGSHGFLARGGGADHYLDRVEEWLQVNGLLTKAAK